MGPRNKYQCGALHLLIDQPNISKSMSNRSTNKKFAGIPKKVKVGYADFDIKTYYPKKKTDCKCHRDKEEASSVGMTFADWSFIKISERQGTREAASTLFHELLHAIVHVFAIPFKDGEEEEKYVSMFSNGISTMFRDNPEFLVWMSKALETDDTINKDQKINEVDDDEEKKKEEKKEKRNRRRRKK